MRAKNRGERRIAPGHDSERRQARLGIDAAIHHETPGRETVDMYARIVVRVEAGAR